MVSDPVIKKLLERFEKALARLESLKNISLENLHEDWKIQGALLYEFQVVIQSMIDLGAHLIAEFNWESPSAYSMIPEILAKHGVIPKDYAETFRKIIAFRNILVHEYVNLDLSQVYENLQKLEDIKKFAEYLNTFLETSSK